MKFILIALMSLFAIQSFADAPAPFQNSDITRKLDDGKVQKFDGDEYMIVKRSPKKKAKVVIKEVKEITKEVRVYNKNALKLFVVNEYDSLSNSGNSISIERGFGLGFGYQRMLDEEYSLELIGTSNKSLLLGLGYHF